MARIVIAGATGLVGGMVVKALSGHDLATVGRRPIAGVAQQKVGPIEEWPGMIAALTPEVAISTLGTTMRKAGSKAAFEAIDHDAVVAVASAAKAAGARQFIMVSSAQADAKAHSFYMRTKGRAEDDVRALNFERLDILQPGLLIGDRPNDPRPLERAFIAISPFLNALIPARFDHYRAIPAAAVAQAIAVLTEPCGSGHFVHRNREMLALVANRP